MKDKTSFKRSNNSKPYKKKKERKRSRIRHREQTGGCQIGGGWRRDGVGGWG